MFLLIKGNDTTKLFYNMYRIPLCTDIHSLTRKSYNKKKRKIKTMTTTENHDDSSRNK